MNSRTKLIVGGVIAGGTMLLAAGLVVGAGIAKSEPVSHGSVGDHSGVAYALELQSVGVGGSPDATDMGTVVCQRRADGTSEHDLIRQLQEPGYSFEMAMTAVLGGEFHFCPQYATTYNAVR